MAIDKRLVFYEGKYIYLKVLTAQDIVESDWVGWFNDESMSHSNQHHYYPNTFEEQHKFLGSCISSSKIQLGIVDRTDEEKICGVVSLDNIDLLHRHAEIAAIQAIKMTASKSELFIESWSLMLRHGFEQLGLQKIYGGTFHPQVAGALTRVFNFEIEGIRKRQVFKDNAYKDITLVAVFSDTIQYPVF